MREAGCVSSSKDEELDKNRKKKIPNNKLELFGEKCFLFDKLIQYFFFWGGVEIVLNQVMLKVNFWHCFCV